MSVVYVSGVPELSRPVNLLLFSLSPSQCDTQDGSEGDRLGSRRKGHAQDLWRETFGIAASGAKKAEMSNERKWADY